MCIEKKYTHTAYVSIQGQLLDNSSTAFDIAADRNKATKLYELLVNLSWQPFLPKVCWANSHVEKGTEAVA